LDKSQHTFHVWLRQDGAVAAKVAYEHTTDQLLDDVKHCLNFIRTHKP